MSILPLSKKMNQAQRWTFSDEAGGSVLPDAVIMDVRVTSGGKVVSEAIEKGSFASYNKVTEPLEISTQLGFNGSDTYLQSVITNLEQLKAAVSYFSIITPVHEYERMTLQAFDYQMSMDDGLGVLYVNADFMEIREVDVAYSTVDVSQIPAQDAQNPSDASVVNTGITSVQSPSESQQSAGNRSKSILKRLGV